MHGILAIARGFLSLHRKKWIWIVLFIWAASLLVLLATSWNVVLVRDYHRMLELARSLSQRGDTNDITIPPWTILIFGTLGFVGMLATIILFFVKLLREMKLNQLQAEFLANVSHELKTPIASIELTSSLLKSGSTTEQENVALWESHQRELKRLRDQVNTILEAARWQFRSTVQTGNFDLELWLTESFPRWQTLLGPDAELKREGETLPRMTRLELSSLNLIADNLIENARKFAQGSAHVTIRTSRETPDRPWKRGRWKIEFRDAGWGFDPTQSKQIFNRFVRGRHEAPYSIPGTGLGLFLARSACKAIGVRIEAKSPGHGHGAVFTLSGGDGSA